MIAAESRLTQRTPGWLRRFLGQWNGFWFNPADPTCLGCIRIFAGLITLYVHLAYSIDLQEFFGRDAWVSHAGMERFRHELPFMPRSTQWDEMYPTHPQLPSPEDEQYMREWGGFDPRLLVAKGYPTWSIWFHVTDPTWMAITHTTILLIMFLFTIGFCTRVTSVLTWLGAVSYIQRGTTSVFGVDTMMNIVLLYLMIGPSGAALSVDRLIARYRAARRALRTRRPAPAQLKPTPLVSANLAVRLLQVHLSLIYLAAGLAKLKGMAWWNGVAVWGTMANLEFSPVHIGPYIALLKFLADHRWLWEISMHAATAFTLVAEIGFAFLIWMPRLRWVALTNIVLLHTGIAVFMGLTTFSLFMLAMILVFVPNETIHRLLTRLGRNAPKLDLKLNATNRRQTRAAALVRAVDVWDQVEIDASTRAETAGLELATETGGRFTGFAAFQKLVGSLRLLWPLWPLACLLGITGIGKALFPGSTNGVAAPHLAGNGKHQRQEERVSR
jgi:hypothetical protein